MSNHYFATCAKGFEDILVHEFEQLGFASIKVANGGVHFEGEESENHRAAYQACLWSRVASRILLKLTDFSAKDDDELYAAMLAIDWSEHMDVSSSFAIDCFSSHTEINNSHYATLRIKDAIVDQFKEKTGIRPDVGRERPDIRMNVYLSDRECIAYLDLSGEALHRRGYRQTTGAAPLRETLAAAMLYRAKWLEKAQKGEPLFDPMCGTATLLIEGAMIAADMAPGLLRDYFGFFGWKQFDANLWQNVHDDAEQGLTQRINDLPPIAGCDYAQSVLTIAQSNIEAAGFASKIKLDLVDSTRTLPDAPAGQGLLITNPPYGKRLGQIQQLRTLYLRLGKMFKQAFPGWDAAVFTSEVELSKSIGLRAFRKNSLFNGAIKCTLTQYHIDADKNAHDGADDGADEDKSVNEKVSETAETVVDGSVTKTVLPAKKTVWEQAAEKRNSQKENNKKSSTQIKTDVTTAGVPLDLGETNEHVKMFVNRLTKNAKHLKKWARKNSITCYRVYDADIPQYSVAIDVYEDWVHVQEYEAPKTVDQTKAFKRLNDVIDVVAEILGVEQANVVLKVRKKQTGKDQYKKQDSKDRKITVFESGLKFRINMYDYLDTGLFLDHRKTRQLIYKLAKGGNFLNLFAYTGSASVYAAAGGAASTTTVDMSNTYIQWAEENLNVNGFSGRSHQFLREDCMQWIWDAGRENKQFDLIFLDPPTFSNSTKMQSAFDVNRDHTGLIGLAMKLLSENGRLIFSTNARRFKLDELLLSEYAVKEISALTVTEDFRRKPLHKCWCLARDEKLLELNLD